MRITSNIKPQIRDAIELWLLPGLAALLPWPWCFKIFKRLSRCDWLYRSAVDAAARQAQARGWAGPDLSAWKARRRLTTLVDHADFFLAATRGPRWLKRHLRIDGHWPDPGQAGLLLTYHWGAGTFGLRHARLSGLQPNALIGPPDLAAWKTRPLMGAYDKRRRAMVVRETGHPTIDVSGPLRPLLNTLAQGQQLLAVIDVPTDNVKARLPVHLLGQRAYMPRGLLHLAQRNQLPVTLYLTGLDSDTGERWLSIQQLTAAGHNLDTLAEQVFGKLDQAIRANPAAWHFWAEAPRFWLPPEALQNLEAQAHKKPSR